MSNNISGIPSQEVGGSHDNRSEKCFENLEIAAEHFKILKDRLMDINAWQDYIGGAGANFAHMDTHGNIVHRPPIIGDFIRIDLPAVSSVMGYGYDWVEIFKVDDSPYDADERLLICCVPTINPKDEDATDIAHFYTDRASSNFIISRKGECITAQVYGRNEITNKDVEHLGDKVRNILISAGGSAGLSKLQWKSFVMGILNFES